MLWKTTFELARRAFSMCTRESCRHAVKTAVRTTWHSHEYAPTSSWMTSRHSKNKNYSALEHKRPSCEDGVGQLHRQCVIFWASVGLRKPHWSETAVAWGSHIRCSHWGPAREKLGTDRRLRKKRGRKSHLGKPGGSSPRDATAAVVDNALLFKATDELGGAGAACGHAHGQHGIRGIVVAGQATRRVLVGVPGPGPALREPQVVCTCIKI